MAVIDIGSWTVAGKVKLASAFHPHHLGLSPDGTRVTVGAPGSDFSAGHSGHGSDAATGALFVMDGRTGDVLVQTTVPGTAHNLAFLPDGASLVYALAERGVLQTADAATLAATGSIDVGKAPLEVTPAGGGNLVLVSNSGAGTIAVVDVGTKRVTKTIPVGMNPIAAWMGGDGRAYVTSESDRKLSVIDVSSLSVRATSDLQGTPGQVITTADGKEVWVAYEDRGKVAIFAAADLRPLAEITVGQRPHGLVLSTDGSRVFVTDETAGKVYEVEVVSRAVTRSLDVGGAPNGILLRPAG